MLGNHRQRVLGVHLRGTDKNPEKATVAKFVRIANAYISFNKRQNMLTNIFLASDDEGLAYDFSSRFPVGIVHTQPGNVLRGGAGGQLVSNAFKDKTKDGLFKGSQVLFDTLVRITRRCWPGCWTNLAA